MKINSFLVTIVCLIFVLTVTSCSTATNNNTSNAKINSDNNYIAPIPEKGCTYNVDEIDFCGAKKISFLSSKVICAEHNEDLITKTERHGNEDMLFNPDGTVFLNNNKIKKHFEKSIMDEYTDIDFMQMYKNYLIVSFSTNYDSDEFNNKSFRVIYDIKKDKVQKINDGSGFLKFSGGFIIHNTTISYNDNISTVYDLNLNKVVPENNKYSFSAISGNRIIAESNEVGDYANNKHYFGLLDFDGNILKDFVYDKILAPEEYDCSEGLGFYGNLYFNYENNSTDELIAEKRVNPEENIFERILIDKNNNEKIIQERWEKTSNNSLVIKPIAHYNGRTYLVKSLAETQESETDGNSKTKQQQIVDEKGKTIIKESQIISGYYNGYCIVTNKDKQGLYDIEGKEILKTESEGGCIKNLSLPDENGLVLLSERYEGDNANYKFKVYDLAKNEVYSFNEGVEGVIFFGNGLFGIATIEENELGYTEPSRINCEKFIRITRR